MIGTIIFLWILSIVIIPLIIVFSFDIKDELIGKNKKTNLSKSIKSYYAMYMVKNKNKK